METNKHDTLRNTQTQLPSCLALAMLFSLYLFSNIRRFRAEAPNPPSQEPHHLVILVLFQQSLEPETTNTIVIIKHKARKRSRDIPAHNMREIAFLIICALRKNWLDLPPVSHFSNSLEIIQSYLLQKRRMLKNKDPPLFLIDPPVMFGISFLKCLPRKLKDHSFTFSTLQHL